MATRTPAEFEAFAKDVAPAAKAVMMAMAHAELERERVDAYIRPIFDSFGFVYGSRLKQPDTGQPITDPKHLYLCDDDARVAEYFDACDAAHRAHGFTGPKHHCPALVAESLQTKTEQQFIELAAPFFNIDADLLHGGGTNRDKFLDLMLRACAKFITLDRRQAVRR